MKSGVGRNRTDKPKLLIYSQRGSPPAQLRQVPVGRNSGVIFHTMMLFLQSDPCFNHLSKTYIIQSDKSHCSTRLNFCAPGELRYLDPSLKRRMLFLWATEANNDSKNLTKNIKFCWIIKKNFFQRFFKISLCIYEYSWNFEKISKTFDFNK